MDDADRTHLGERPRAGDLLRDKREAMGWSLADVAARTRVPSRHLEAIEASDYAALPSSTYAVGFARAYARAVGADEVAVAQQVRADVAGIVRRRPEYEPYVTADPARLPSRGIAVVGAGVALAIVVLVGLWFGTDWFRRDNPASVAPVVASVPAAPAPAVSPTPAGGGQVTLTATDEVWLRVYDAADQTLFIGTMKPGDRFDVPGTADNPRINVGRPDKLSVTLNGSAVPPLGTGERPIKDVPVSAAAIAARLAGSPAPTATPTGAPAASAAVPRSTATRPPARPRPRIVPSQDSETRRANLASARAAARD